MIKWQLGLGRRRLGGRFLLLGVRFVSYYAVRQRIDPNRDLFLSLLGLELGLGQSPQRFRDIVVVKLL